MVMMLLISLLTVIAIKSHPIPNEMTLEMNDAKYMNRVNTYAEATRYPHGFCQSNGNLEIIIEF